MPEDDYAALRDALAEFELFVVGDGLATPLGDVYPPAYHQTWVRERGTGIWRLDVIREPWNGDTWLCRRDPSIGRPGSEVIAHTAEGIPYQRPEIALLFKAKHTREKDRADFDAVLPLLDADARAWLTDALALVHPGHLWLDLLRAEVR